MLQQTMQKYGRTILKLKFWNKMNKTASNNFKNLKLKINWKCVKKKHVNSEKKILNKRVSL